MNFDKIQFIDGAMGTILQSKGLDTLPEIWNITKPEIISEIHNEYAAAGCDIIKTNTFGANILKLKNTGYSPAEVITAGVKLVKNTGKKAAMDIGPTGKLLAPMGDLNFEEAVRIFAEMVRAGDAAGADLILIETMSDTFEIKAAMIAAKENSNLPIMVTFSPDKNGRLLTGADILTTAVLIESLGASIIGLNCGTGPKEMMGFLKELAKYVSIPISFSPNGGLPKVVGDKTVFDLSPEDYANEMKAAVTAGAAILGGCCGTTPAHMAKVIKTLKGQDVIKQNVPVATRISSFGETVTLGKDFTIIGERINPTGKARLKQALNEKDLNYICTEALSQIDQGAKLLDVNVGVLDMAEEEMLPMVVKAIQSITSVPLVIDTVNEKAAEAALRVYNGKPMLNSVNGKKESMDSLLPIAKKYGASIVALALDNEIPETAAERISVAERIIENAESHGIPKHDIVVDPLTLTISTNPMNASITLEAIEHLTVKTGVCTVLGLSNISFGLPSREPLNAGFFIMAAAKGLSSAIVNPGSSSLLDAVLVYNVLSGRDTNCEKYVERFKGQPKEKKVISTEINLYDAIVKGLEEAAAESAKKALVSHEPMEIIKEFLISALDTVGKDFGAGKLFLPQLLVSANAAKMAFEVIKAHMANKGLGVEKRGKIVLATVKGDVHDIGKNIVRAVVENYNYQVIDLGKNVDTETIVKTVLEEGVKLVGLSALMTTTVHNMEETINALKKASPDCKIMVGGAVLTEDYAKKIGADFYSPDALGAVKFAEDVFKV